MQFRENITKHILPVVTILVISFFYISHFDSLAVPSADYIGNFLPVVEKIAAGGILSIPNKLLPAYPLLLAAVSSFRIFESFDPVYTYALIINMLLAIPYFYFVYRIYREFLSQKSTAFALLFLAFNPYTLYMAINAELEMFLSVMCVGAFYSMIKKGRLHTLFAAVAALTKWNSVFIIPASALFEGMRKRKFSRFVIYGFAAGSLFLIWFLILILYRGVGENAYVGEIARRGPNIYRFYLDAVSVVSGFVQWIGLDIYTSGVGLSALPGFLVLLIVVPLLLWSLLYGFYRWIKVEHPLKWPITVYIGGYFLIHMIYQNTKARYVLPILWFLHLLAAIGVERVITLLSASLKKSRAGLVAASFGALLLVLTLIKVSFAEGLLVLFPVALALFAYSVLLSRERKTGFSLLLIFFIWGSLVLANHVAYGRAVFRHYSERRVEFKELGIYLADTLQEADKLLLTERNVVRYYSKIANSNIMLTMGLKSETVDSLLLELKEKGITYIYIDDFYIRRLKLGDKNAIDKKAGLMEELKLYLPESPDYALVKKIEVGDTISGYLYKRVLANTAE